MRKMRRSIVFGLGVALGALAVGTWLAYGQDAASSQTTLADQLAGLSREVADYLLAPSTITVKVVELPGDWQAKLQQLLDVDAQGRGGAEPPKLALEAEATLTASRLPDTEYTADGFELLLTMPSLGKNWSWSFVRSTGPPKGTSSPDGLPGFSVTPPAEEGQQ